MKGCVNNVNYRQRFAALESNTMKRLKASVVLSYSVTFSTFVKENNVPRIP